MLATITLQRLAFIRYLFSLATQQSRQPEPLGAASILAFHDSVELFLQLASEHLDAGAAKLDFMAYWDILKPKLNQEVAQKESMRRLNKSRVALKHHGTLPSRLDIEAFRTSVANFFEDNTPLVFGMDFSNISMLDLVRCAEVKSSLTEAQELMKQGKTAEALVKISMAFTQLIDDYERRKRTRFGRSPFFFGESLDFETSFHMDIKDRKFAAFVDKVGASLEALRNAMKVLSLGLDYRRYAKFQILAPPVHMNLKGEVMAPRRDKEPSSDDCHFCFDFVIDSAIRLGDFDYDVDS